MSNKLFIWAFLMINIILIYRQGPSLPIDSFQGTLKVKAPRLTSCDDRILDEMDHTFNQRREARQNETPATISRAPAQLYWFDLFEPEAVCFSDERFGGSGERYKAFGDGPKFVCGADFIPNKSSHAGEDCLVYSVGSHNQIDFEKSVHNFLGCETHTFDPTLSKPFVGGDYAHFHPWGLGLDGEKKALGNNTWVGKSLATIMKALGHENRTIDVLKIDCEGCEFSALPPFFGQIALGHFQVNQLQVEMHAGDRKHQDIVDFFAAADKAKLRIFHKERNHWGCGGYLCVEYSFASESFLREANQAVMCPGRNATVLSQ